MNGSFLDSADLSANEKPESPLQVICCASLKLFSLANFPSSIIFHETK